jgi:exoribonuclease R
VTTAPLRLAASAAELADDFARVRADLDVPAGFPPDVVAEADAVLARGPVLPPDVSAATRRDARDLELVTIDPAGSRDLDQAFHAERQGSGFLVQYAIADVGAFVTPGGALDREAWARGETLYLPDGRAPLYPDVVGEGAASLLPEVDRPAVLWTFELDRDARPLATRCDRATVRSRAAWSYVDAQAAIERGDAPPALLLLRELGELLLERERERGGVSIAAPNQEVVRAADGTYSLELEAPLAVETWNAQISLLTGREAARIMQGGGVGLVRTLPPPDDGILGRLRHTARALGVPWPSGASYADVVRGLRPTDRGRATFLLQALHALRGAGYAVVTPDAPVPVHAAVGAPYAHVTAPLRRLADRHVNEIVLACTAGHAPPAWAVEALPLLAETMPRADRRAGAVDRASVDAVEVALLADHVSATFPATVIDRHRRGVVVLLAEIPVVATVVTADRRPLGAAVTVRLDALDPVARTLSFSLLPR